MSFSKNNGQSMFELMIAVAITAVTLVAIVSLVGTSIGNTSFSRDRTIAARLSNEALEWFRLQRDQSFTNLYSKGTVSGKVICLNELEASSLDTGACPLGSKVLTDQDDPTSQPSIYTREATIIADPAEPNIIEIQVVTRWADSAGQHESRLSTVLSNWRSF